VKITLGGNNFMIKNILFDMDGTLLPMDQEIFTKAYFKLLCKKLAPYGYNPEQLISAVWEGTGAMVNNNGEHSNEELFWGAFSKVLGEKALEEREIFDDFYVTDFNLAKDFCGFNEESGRLVKNLKAEGYNLVLASNPIFPMVAQKNRLSWAGVDSNAFSYITSYENSRHCKPNPDYYLEIADKLGLNPKECLMIGNDLSEDVPATKIGMKIFIVTDCLINKENVDIDKYPHGNFADAKRYIDSLK
jgi:FMN phosphatase YigB (HAD superfamily)